MTARRSLEVIAKVLEVLRANYTVDTERGLVFNKKGKSVGYIHEGRYRIDLIVEGKRTMVLRSNMIYWAATGEWPVKDVDHESRIKTDDRIDNLADLAKSDNALNAAASDGRELPPGVYWHKYAKKYIAKFSGKQIGYFKTVEEASQAYKEAKSKSKY